MINRVLDFSEVPARLHVHLSLLVVERPDASDVTMPLADLAVIVVSHPQVTYTQAVLAGLAEAGGAFVACNRKGLPVGMLLPLVSHHVQTSRFAAQARASAPVRKRLWQQLVRAKIKAQADALTALFGSDFGIGVLGSLVRSGDPENVEARAARRYWPQLFADSKFRRERHNEDQNILLNYGYAVLRAIVARAICGAGLHPSLGVHHHNQYNPYCLADDLMEPFRPVVDRSVAEYVADHDAIVDLDAAAKRKIIGDLTDRYLIGDEQRTLFDTASRIASSLVNVLLGAADEIELPDRMVRCQERN
jgi:CRISPR-associated protein Cas1